MRRPSAPARIWAAPLPLVALLVGGCTGLPRTATINQTPQVSGAATGRTLEAQLHAHGLSGAHVLCAKHIIVNIGTTTRCDLTGAGGHHVVGFKFQDLDGTIDLASVRAS